MPMYSRDGATRFRTVDRWDDGVGWMSHPDEDGVRATRFAARTAASGSKTASTPPSIDTRRRSETQDSGCDPLPGWHEAIAYRESDGTRYVPGVLGTAPLFTVGAERIGVYLLRRPFPPRRAFVDCDPERILVGHGEGVFEGAATALADAFAGARQAVSARTSRKRRATARARRGGDEIRRVDFSKRVGHHPNRQRSEIVSSATRIC